MKFTHRLLVFLLLPYGSLALYGAPPVIRLTKDALTVSSVTPGGAVALLSVARESAYSMARIVSRRELLVDDDGDGKVQYAPQAGIAFSSIWIAADVATGEIAMAAPDGMTPLIMDQRGAGEGKAVEAVVNGIDAGRTSLDILVVRAGVGAWSMRAFEGTDADRDGRVNGRLRVDLSKLQPLNASYGAAPHALKKGDVVALLDSDRMEYWMTTAQGEN